MNHNTRTLIVGDLHGCLPELEDLLRKVRYQPGKDRVVLLGDLVDKGPYGAETVSFARKNHFLSLRGNHEDRYRRYRMHEDRAKMNPGYFNPMRPLAGADLDLYNKLSPGDWAYLKSLPLVLEWDDTVLVHAGLSPNTPLAKQASKHLLNIGGEGDNEHWSASYSGPHHVIYGHSHTHNGKPRIVSNAGSGTTFGLDTGCVYGQRLTCMIISGDVSFESVPARKVYVTPRVSRTAA